MHPSCSARVHQQKRIRRHAANSDAYTFFNLLIGPDLLDMVESLLPDHRERLFPPTETRSMFLAQALNADRSCQRARRNFRLAVKVSERTLDKKKQALLAPEVEVEGWWTSLTDAPETVIAHYAYHGTHEQFHSEIKTDLDLERLPSGKFGANDAVLHLGMFAYNCLRLIGQLGLTGEI